MFVQSVVMERFNFLRKKMLSIHKDQFTCWLNRRYRVDNEYRTLTRSELESRDLCDAFPTPEESELFKDRLYMSSFVVFRLTTFSCFNIHPLLFYSTTLKSSEAKLP